MAAPRTAAEWDAFFGSALPGGSGSGTARPIFSGLESSPTAFATATGRNNLRLYEGLYSGPSVQPQRFRGSDWESPSAVARRRTKERSAKLSPADDDGFSLSGLFKNAAGDVVDLVTGVPGMIELGGKAVLGLGGTVFTGGANDTAKRWLTESAGLLKDGVVESGKQWGRVLTGDLKPLYEDPFFMALDAAAVATAGAGATVKGAAIANKAARNAAQKQRGTRADPKDPFEPHVRSVDNKGNVNNPLAAILDFSRSADKGQRKRDNWDSAEGLGGRARREPRLNRKGESTGKVKAGPLSAQRILRAEYLKGRDLDADPLSAAERVALATNWSRLNPTARASVMRLGPVTALSNAQRGVLSFAEDGGNPVTREGYEGTPGSALELDSNELIGFRRSRGIIRRGIQNKFDDFVLGPKANWGQRRSAARSYAPNTRRDFLTRVLDPTQRQIGRATRRAKREAMDEINSALVKAGGMTAAASARAVNKDPELAFLTRELVEGSVRSTSIISDLNQRKLGIQERIDSGNLEADAVKRAEETLVLINRLMKEDHPVHKSGTKQQNTLYNAVNSFRRTAYELDKRGFKPWQLIEEAGKFNWRDPIGEARTAAARMNRAGQKPLVIAGRGDGQARVVDPVAFLRKEREAQVRYRDAESNLRLGYGGPALAKQDISHEFNERLFGRLDNGQSRKDSKTGDRYKKEAADTPLAPDVEAAKAIATRLFSNTARGAALESLSANGGRFTKSEQVRLSSSGRLTQEDVESLQVFNQVMNEIEANFKYDSRPSKSKFQRRLDNGELGISQSPIEILSRNLEVRIKFQKDGRPVWFNPNTGRYSKFGANADLDPEWRGVLNPNWVSTNKKRLWQKQDTFQLERLRETLGLEDLPDDLRFPLDVRNLIYTASDDPLRLKAVKDAREQIASSLDQYVKALDERYKAAGKELTIAEKDRRSVAFFAAKALRDEKFMERLAADARDKKIKAQGEDKANTQINLNDLLDSDNIKDFSDAYVYSRTAWILRENADRTLRPGAGERLGSNEVIVDWERYQDQVRENNRGLVDRSYTEDVIGDLSPYRDSIFWNHTRREVGEPDQVMKGSKTNVAGDPGDDLAIRQRDYTLWMNGELSVSVEPFMRQLDLTVRSAGNREFLQQVLSTWGLTADDGRLLVFDDETALKSTVSTEFYEAVPLAQIIEQARFTAATRAVSKDGTTFTAKDNNLAGRAIDKDAESPIFNYLNNETVRVARKNGTDPDGSGQVVAIPKSVWAEIKVATESPNKFLQGYDTLLNAWRAGMLAAAPRWFLNNFLGNTFFVGMANGLDFRAFSLSRAQRGKGGTSERYSAELGADFDAQENLLTRSQVNDMVDRGDKEVFSAREWLPYGIEGNTYSSQGQSTSKSGFTNGKRDDLGFGDMDDLPTDTNARRYAEGGTQMGQRYWKATDSLFRLNQGFEAVMRRAIYVSRGKKALRESGRNVPRFWDRQYDNYQLLQDIADLPDSTKREILRETRSFIGDYGSLTRVERSVLRRVIPFYSWIRVLNTWLFGLPFRSPLRAELLATASQVGAAAFGEDQSILPWWERGRLGFGDVRLRTAGSNPLMTAVEPVRDLATRSTIDPASMASELVKTYLGSASPQLGGIMALGGMNMFGDRRYTSPQNYGEAVTPFGSGNKYLNEATGEIEERSAHPHVSDLLLDALPGTSFLAPMVRQAVSGQRRPYDTSSTMSLVLNELGVGAEGVDDLYQPPRRSDRGREPLFGDRTSAIMSYLGAPLNRIDPLAERLAYIGQQARFNQEKIRQGPRIGRESVARKLEGYGG